MDKALASATLTRSSGINFLPADPEHSVAEEAPSDVDKAAPRSALTLGG